ncbi:ABC transporter permease [Tunturiibacter empetritectus]|uniref:Permease n=2 Tax=Tunturiibacter TaxID=3154218 RepID=A0A852VJ48_9BACT|nr:ABC transporter permease [Edaphobacter lichenicola]NYF91650.1 putative permease [Edaphobacter lichenicola]
MSRSKVNREIDAELRSHIELRIEDNLAAGMSAEDARRDALLRFGNLTSTKEHVAGADTALTLDSIWSDLCYACRQLWKNPGFACTAILVLTLGMCASIAIFAFVDAVLISPLPYQVPSRLAGLFESTPLGPRFHLSYLDYLDWKRQNKVFSSVEAYDSISFALKTATETQRVEGATVSAGFFRTLGVAPIVGRDFGVGEDTPSAPRTVIVSYAAWQSRFGKRQDLLGQTVTLNGEPSVIIGVLPQDFHFALTGQTEFWTALSESSDPKNRGNHGLSAIARLKDGITWEAASSDMRSIAQQLAKQYPDSDEGRGATVLPLTEVLVGSLRPVLLLLLCGAVLLLLIACVNVSGLLLVRSENRRHEIAIRGALGASRMRLLRQFVTEGVMLAATGSLLGVCAACGAIHLLKLLMPVNMLMDMPYLKGLGLNLHVMGFAVAIGLAMANLFSLTPILRLSLADLRTGLTEGGRSSSRTVWSHLGANLVALELSAAMVLLVGAGLLGKSFYRLMHADIGFQTDHLASMRLLAPLSRYAKDEQQVALARHVMDETNHLPGVQSVAIAHQIPVANVAGGNTTFEVIGRPQHGSEDESSSRNVSVDYFSTVRARLVRGRYFSEGDDVSKPRVTIVNRSFTRKYFAGEDPIGRQIRYDATTPAIEIVGIVDDLKEGPLDEEVQPVLYTPFNQEPDNAFFLVARTAQEPQELLKSLEATVHRIDPEILTFNAETMEDRINHSQSTYLHRSSACLVGGFAAIALLLGVVGLYGLIAYSVSQRTREIGVRIAMGAQRSSVYKLILKEAGRLAAIGILAGLICSVVTASLMRKILFGTQPWDAGTLAGVALVLSISALLASYIPAHRAASVNPVEALRAE